MDDPNTFSAPLTALNDGSVSPNQELGQPVRNNPYKTEDPDQGVNPRAEIEKTPEGHGNGKSLESFSTTTSGQKRRVLAPPGSLGKDDEEEDEETLQLELAAIEAKLKLKRLQQRKSKAGAPDSDFDHGDFKKDQSSRKENLQPSFQNRSPNGMVPLGSPGSATDVQSQDNSEYKADSHTIDDIEVAAKSSDLEANVSTSSHTSDSDQKKDELAGDPNIVDWDGPDDPKNPMNWPAWKIKAQVFLVSAITFVSPLGSSILATGIPQIMAEFHSTNEELGSLVVSIYLLGFAAGPLVIAPLSEMYGRLPLYHSCNTIFAAFTVACAVAPSMNSLIALRFLQGCAGSAPLAIGGGTITDLIPQERRGAYMGIYALGPTLGPVIGPVAGGFLTGAKGWRWLMWLLLMIEGTIAIASYIFLRETYGVVILARKTRALQRKTGNMALRSVCDYGLTTRRLWRNTLIRPAKMLVFSPIILLLSLFMAVVYGYLYLLFTTFPVVFGQYYHFSIGITGLVYLGLGVGNIIGLVMFGIFSDKVLLAKAASGELKPEYRLLPMVWTAFTFPIGLVLYGWSAKYALHWIVPVIGTSFFGIGLLVTIVCTLTYIVDAFTEYAASATAANAVMRSVVGATLPLAGPKMYQALGIGWGNSLLAFIALAGCPIPWLFYKYGERIRKSSNATY